MRSDLVRDISVRQRSPDRYAHVVNLTMSRARMFAGFLLWRMANKIFAFAFTTAAIITAKIIHIIAHEKAFSRRHLALWALSFFAQDLLLLVLLRASFDLWQRLPRNRAALRAVVSGMQWGLMMFASTVCIVNITFYACSRSQMHWRNVDFAKDASSRGVLLSGLASLIGITLGLTAIACVFRDVLFCLAGVAVDAFSWPLIWLRRLRGQSHDTYEYTSLSKEDGRTDGFSQDEKHKLEFMAAIHVNNQSPGSAIYLLFRALWFIIIVLEVAAYSVRPFEGSLTYMSWTPPVIPFIEFKDSASTLRKLVPVYGNGINNSWDNITALREPIHFSWLPRETVLKGFEDWYEIGAEHYNAAADPLKVSNHEEDILPELQKGLSDVSIKHIVLIVLESNRKDVFPIKKNGLIWNTLAEQFPENKLSEDAVEFMQSLTPSANYLTGEYDDGFAHDASNKSRGGLNMKDSYTAATYTRKSMLGTLCGISPLVADFNMEYLHHIYQPCLPHILEAFNVVDEHNATSSPMARQWRSQYMQSTILSYDHADISTEQFGFRPDNIIGVKYLQSPSAKFGQVDLPFVNYFGMVEPPLMDYIHDSFAMAKESDERLFLTHLTSTTHHPWRTPENETYVPLDNDRLEYLSQYVNTIGYSDRWIGKILEALDQEGVADETLVILTGDHGASLPENGKPGSYYNPNVGCDHVPTIISHPKLPPVDISDKTSTIDILPTVLDLLRETGSLSEPAAKVAGDLLANSEGQSLIRKPGRPKLHDGQDGDDASLSHWQFVVMNPGRAMIGVLDKRRPNWRLVAPVIHNIEWRFTDLESDPTDTNPVEAFEFADLIKKTEQRFSRQEAMWAERAAFVARWWVEENNKRWQYAQYEKK